MEIGGGGGIGIGFIKERGRNVSASFDLVTGDCCIYLTGMYPAWGEGEDGALMVQ